MNIPESDKIAYDNLECKNISLETFTRNRLAEEKYIARVTKRYRDDLKKSQKPLVEKVDTLRVDDVTCVTRTIVLDGANIMHCGSPYQDSRDNPQHNIPDVAALLSVMRFFVARKFEVFAVISRKYVKPDATNYKEGIDKLVKNHLCVVVPHTNLDDTVALEFAAQINGVVLTSDQYRDHAAECPRSCRIVGEHRLGIEWGENINKNSHSKNHRDDYLPAKRFSFKTDDGQDMNEDDVIKRVYSFPDQLQYSISKERRKLADPDGKRRKVLALLDELIVEGIPQYRDNVQRILATPVHVPNESAAASNSDLEDTLREVPLDSQAEFIDYVQDDELIDW